MAWVTDLDWKSVKLLRYEGLLYWGVCDVLLLLGQLPVPHAPGHLEQSSMEE